MTCRRDEVSERSPSLRKGLPHTEVNTRLSPNQDLDSKATSGWRGRGACENKRSGGDRRMLPGTAAMRAHSSWDSAALSRCSARRADVPEMFLKTHMTRGGRSAEPPGQAHRWSNTCRGRPG